MHAQAEKDPAVPGSVYSLRVGRESKIRLPVDPNVQFIEVGMKVELEDGRPVVRYFLPAGGKISNKPRPKKKVNDASPFHHA
jgi:hypothetical protein